MENKRKRHLHHGVNPLVQAPSPAVSAITFRP